MGEKIKIHLILMFTGALGASWRCVIKSASTIRKLRIVQQVGQCGIQSRQWAAATLKQHLVEHFILLKD